MKLSIQAEKNILLSPINKALEKNQGMTNGVSYLLYYRVFLCYVYDVKLIFENIINDS